MKFKFFLTMIFYSLLRRRMRMAVALLAVAVGATIISGMVTVYREVPQQLGREFRAYGANLLILPAGDSATFDQSHIESVSKILANHEIVGIAPFLYERLEINKQPILSGGTNFDELQKVSPYWQIDGEFPKSGKCEILLGKDLSEKFSPIDPKSIIGKNVSVSAGEGSAMRNYKVVGIVSTGGREEEFAFLDLAELQSIVEKPNQIGLAQVSVVADQNSLTQFENEIRNSDSAIVPQSVQQIARSEFSVLGKLQALVLLVTLIVLLLTLICVTTTMMAVVTERRKEIGLKKELGASNQNIVSDFLGEGCLLGAFGGLLGSGLGYLFAQSVSLQVFSRGIDFSISIAILSIVLSIIVTGVASMIPVRIATNVDPAIVLRGE